MDSKWITSLTLGALAAIAVMVSVASVQVATLGGKMDGVLPRVSTMQTLTEDVTRPDGRKVKVTTTRMDGESIADWIARHDAAVAALLGG